MRFEIENKGPYSLEESFPHRRCVKNNTQDDGLDEAVDDISLDVVIHTAIAETVVSSMTSGVGLFRASFCSGSYALMYAVEVSRKVERGVIAELFFGNRKIVAVGGEVVTPNKYSGIRSSSHYAKLIRSMAEGMPRRDSPIRILVYEQSDEDTTERYLKKAFQELIDSNECSIVGH